MTPGGIIHRSLIPLPATGTLKACLHEPGRTLLVHASSYDLIIARRAVECARAAGHDRAHFMAGNCCCQNSLIGDLMLSRRHFVGLTAAGLGASSLLPAQADPACPPMPPSIAGLKSRKSEAHPITAEERRARQEKARALMAANNLDALMVTPGTSLRYFAGVKWWDSERFFAMVLPTRGQAFYVCPAFEEGRAREQLARGPEGDHGDVRVWQEDENPYDLLAQGLRDRGILTRRLGVEETAKFVFSDGVAQAAPQVHIASGTAVTAGCRRVKSEHELALMSLANQVTLAAYEATYHAIKEGMSQAEVQQLVSDAHQQLGFSGGADVQMGEYSAFPHGSLTAQMVREGVIIMMDGGCEAEGYQSDITRTFVLGKATEKMKQVFDIVHRAQSTALKTARPGIEAQAVDAAARKVITGAGYGPGYKFFVHRVGHGIGMDGHEWPYLVHGDTLKLEPHMTFSDEPGIYIRGEFGMRLEDDMHITESGAELFTPQCPSLENPFAKG